MSDFTKYIHDNPVRLLEYHLHNLKHTNSSEILSVFEDVKIYIKELEDNNELLRKKLSI